MQRRWLLLVVAALVVSSCAPSVDVAKERDALMAADRAWSQTTKDVDKFASYYAPDANMYAPNMPLVSGAAKIRETFAEMAKAPGFSLHWTASKAEVSASGDLGYTTGTYQMSMNGATDKGKFVTTWKKQSDGSWKVVEDIINSDLPAGPPPGQPVMTSAADLKWGDAPPVLPAGAKMAVVSGDPGKAELYVVRLQVPAGYRIAPHWHPTDEHVTALAGTVALGMGDSFDQKALKDIPSGGYFVAPAQMHHFFMAKTAATIQVHGMGPFAITYVNPADDPSKQAAK
jgi:ketosteroid isomerase-like protein/quercetin dioxygenase-like cupin family protein